MLRDTLRSEEYFIKRYKKDIQRLQNAIVECNNILKIHEDDAHKKRICYYDIYLKRLQAFYSRYSLGISINELRKNGNITLMISIHSIFKYACILYNQINEQL